MDLDEHSKNVCKNLLADLITITQGNSSIKFFRKDVTTMLIWLYVMDAYANNKKINIEDIARGISTATRLSKPSLRLILENAKQKGFLKFTHSTEDSRSWEIEPEKISVSQFNECTKRIV
jgi:hypothetical protein